MEASGIWEPYFKPTTRVHSSGFRCFECGYLQIGDKNEAAKKVIIATRVDHIMTFDWSPVKSSVQEINLDLLKSGEIRIFSFGRRLYWAIPGSSDAHITTNKEPLYPWQHNYEELDEIWEKQTESKMSEIKYRVWSKKQKTYDYEHPFNEPGDFYITQNGVLFSDYGNAITPEVKQENFIIEQSTDIKDKNGNMIYVGDIVKMKFPYDKRFIGRFVVIKDPNSPQIGLLDETKTDEIFNLYNHMSNYYEIIGNINE